MDAVTRAGAPIFRRLEKPRDRVEEWTDKAKIPRDVYLRFVLPLVLGLVSLLAFCLAVFMSVQHSMSQLVNTHG